jgi:NADPH-dependent 2,4-dienoyl-CoA reductase/sulfur reductase-like enzyme
VTERLVVIGGGASGMFAASAARRVDPGLEVVVLEATAHAAYGLCGLPYLVSGVIGSPEAPLSHPPDFFRRQRGFERRVGEGVRPEFAPAELERRFGHGVASACC